MRKALNGFLWLIGLAVVLTVYFFVPLGRFTLYEHTLRIAATEPAQELGDDVGQATRDLGQQAMDEWEDRREIRDEVTGESGADDESGGTLRLRIEEDGVHIGDEVLSPSELRERIGEAREVADDVRAILEAADDLPTPDVDAIRALLEDEHVAIE